MITPKLEEMILCGKAFFKTFVAGGDKHTLTFGNDRFIIITDITYFPMNISTDEGAWQNANTQVAIYGERGYNHFIFRNWNDSYNEMIDFCSPVTIHTYLLHEQQVGFSFCNAPFFTNLNFSVADTNNPGYAPNLDWGIDGQPGAVSTIFKMTDANSTMQNNLTILPSMTLENQQLFTAFIDKFQFGGNIDQRTDFPLLHVNYVEVLGSANNIQI